MTKIELYTRPGCSYCVHAKRLLSNKGLAFEEYNVYQNPERLNELQNRTSNRTYPQVFIDNRPIGGFEELALFNRQGLLSNGIEIAKPLI